jgi:hypothetical protein
MSDECCAADSFKTIFSMSFFNWIPKDSNQVVSPWIAIFFVLFIVTTGLTLSFGHFLFKEKIAEEDVESGHMSDSASRGSSAGAGDGADEKTVQRKEEIERNS